MFLPDGYLYFSQAAAFIPEGKLTSASDEERATKLGGALAGGLLASSGVVVGYDSYDEDPPEAGKLITLRPEIWRSPQARDAVLGSNASNRLVQDHLVVVPVISQAALGQWLHDMEAPEPPKALPQLVEPMTPDDRLAEWMRGYAACSKARGALVKREEAVRAACAAHSCTTRQAEAAFGLLPYPELRNPPRIAAA